MLDRLGISLPTFSEWVALLGGLYEVWGYPLVLIAAALENTLIVNLFFPGGTILVLGGVYARLGNLELPAVIALGWAGTLFGASFDYFVGRGGGRGPLGPLLRHRRVAVALGRAGELLARYGLFAFVAGHFMSHTRSLVAVAAGLTGLPAWRFAVFELPAALLWSTAYVVGGYLLADQLPLFEEIMNRFGWVIAATVGTFVAWQIWRTLRETQSSAA